VARKGSDAAARRQLVITVAPIGRPCNTGETMVRHGRSKSKTEAGFQGRSLARGLTHAGGR
jgi:hypothetical protein